MKKLLLLLVAFAFIAVVPRVASAFTLIELMDVGIPQFSMLADGSVQIDVALNKDQAAAYGADVIEGVQIPNVGLAPFSAALSNAAILRGSVKIYMVLDDQDGDGVPEVRAFRIGK